MNKNTDSIKFLLSVMALSCVVYFLYVPGLSGPFLFDDFPNLEPLGYFGGVTDLQSAQRFIFGNSSGPTGRPVSMASFLLNDSAWPSVPFYFKKTNLLLHIACGLMALLALNRLLSGQKLGKGSSQLHWLSFVVIALWLLHPINLSTVLYSVQRMAILSAFFSMASLYFYLAFRERHIAKSSFRGFGYLALSCLLLVLGIFSKENAVLLIFFILVLEIAYFEESVFPRGAQLLKEHFVLVVLGGGAVVILSSGWWGQGYDQRDFGLYDRVRYQLPVVGDYILKIIMPRVVDFNLFSGDYEVINGERFSLVDILKSIITALLFLVLIFAVKRKNKLMVLGLSWFFVFHLLESTFYPLEVYFEHRNYLPSIGLILFAVACGDIIFRNLFSGSFVKKSAFVAGAVYLSLCLFLLSLTWARTETLFLKWEMDEPRSARAKVVYASLLEQKTFPENSIEHIDRAIKLRPEAIGLYLKKIRLICQYSLNHSLAEVEAMLQDADQFDMGVVPAMSDLIKIDDDGDGHICEDMGYPIAFSQLFSQIEAADAVAWNATRAARYYALKSDFFASNGDLDISVKALDKAISYTPTVDVYLKKSVMLASAGLSDEAFSSLKLAEVADENRAAFYPSRMDEIRQLRKLIKNSNQLDPKKGVPDNGQ